MSQAKKILVVGPSWVGDMVMAQSLFMVLKQQMPTALIDVLAPGWTIPLLDRMPEVNQGIEMIVGHGKLMINERKTVAKKLSLENYDQAILLPNSLKSALIPFWAGIPRRTGFLGEIRFFLVNDRIKLDKKQLTMTVQRFVSLGLPKDSVLPEKIPQPKLQISKASVEQSLNKYNINQPDKTLIALCPGAEYGPAKQWPLEHFASVANHYIEQGCHVWIFGSEKDVLAGQKINELTQQRCLDFTGKTSLSEAIDFMSLSSVVVSNDSGLMHVAAALDKHIIAIYGSSDPKFTPPLSDKSHILSLELSCSPCFKRECPLGHLECLKELMPSLVIEQIDESIV
ncbi:MAG: lipopolysaccharide heptosyltransferase II [Methylococcales bacterium]|jgi:heptosyltransferase II|nr:lipopolysaccharide heptosyltransferase II [Methylococcales bacterium]MBT7408809.1 lipopolysaccharide heptosyltransferase II [Methylococcales bacterium]